MTQDRLTFLSLDAPRSPRDCATDPRGPRRLHRSSDEAAVTPLAPGLAQPTPAPRPRPRLQRSSRCARPGRGCAARQAEAAQPPPLRPPLSACAPRPQPPTAPLRGGGGAAAAAARRPRHAPSLPHPTAALGRGRPPPARRRLRRHARLQRQPSLGRCTMARRRRRTPRAPRLPGRGEPGPHGRRPRCRAPNLARLVRCTKHVTHTKPQPHTETQKSERARTPTL